MKKFLYIGLVLFLAIALSLLVIAKTSDASAAGVIAIESSPQIAKSIGAVRNAMLVGVRYDYSVVNGTNRGSCANLIYFVTGDTGAEEVEIRLRAIPSSETWTVYEVVEGFFSEGKEECRPPARLPEPLEKPIS